MTYSMLAWVRELRLFKGYEMIWLIGVLLIWELSYVCVCVCIQQGGIGEREPFIIKIFRIHVVIFLLSFQCPL